MTISKIFEPVAVGKLLDATIETALHVRDRAAAREALSSLRAIAEQEVPFTNAAGELLPWSALQTHHGVTREAGAIFERVSGKQGVVGEQEADSLVRALREQRRRLPQPPAEHRETARDAGPLRAKWTFPEGTRHL